MDSEYPPLPSSRGPGSSVQASSFHKATNAPPSEELRESISKQKSDSQQGERDLSQGPQSDVNTISSTGDVIIEYGDGDYLAASSVSGRRWLVSSEDLIRNSPYFRALLDPNKFSEGRHFMKQKTDWSRKTAAAGEANDENAHVSVHALPTLSLPVDQFTQKLGVDAIEIFLRVLSFQSLDDDEKKRNFDAEMKLLPPSLVARLVEIADAFNSPQVIRETLGRSGYTFGKGRVSLSRFNQSLLRMSEDRIRQIIYIAHFLGEQSVFQVLTHTLIVVGSRFWVNGVEAPISDDTLRWLYFTDGLEEELYHRRQCVMNTITDLQAHFLRAYGALEEDTGPKPTTANHPMTVPATSTTIRPRKFQCRFGFANSNACDAFHLGQMTRFFALRTKTIFLGSTLLDPDFTLDSDEEDEEEAGGEYSDATKQRSSQATTPSGPPNDITAIIASIKQLPDYQIDSNHTGCGVRRRIIPALDCIERFVGDGRGLLGVTLRPGDGGHESPLAASSWANRSLRRAQSVDIRLSKISAIHYTTPGSARSASQEEDVRLFFTAKKRHWEA